MVDINVQFSSTVGNPSDYLLATLEPETQVQAVGSDIAPFLAVQLQFQPRRTGPFPTLWQMRGSLYRGTGSDVPLSIGAWVSPSAALIPVTPAIIRAVGQERTPDAEQRVKFTLKIDILVAVDDGNSPGSLAVMQSNPISVEINAPRWATFLQKWGYPATRWVPLTLQLPGTLSTEAPAAAEHWKQVCESLTALQEAHRMGQWPSVGTRLRPVIQEVFFTWCAVWGEPAPGKSRKMNEVFAAFDTWFPESTTHPWGDNLDRSRGDLYHRAYARYISLRSLYGVSHAPHHADNREIYTPDDIDYLTTTITALCVGLPCLWAAMPQAPEPPLETHAGPNA